MENDELEYYDELAEIHALHEIRENMETEELERARNLFTEISIISDIGNFHLIDTEKLSPVLSELETILSRGEEYEMCSRVLEWRSMLTIVC